MSHRLLDRQWLGIFGFGARKGVGRTEEIPRDIVRLDQSISRGVGHECKPLDRADQLHVPLAQTSRKRSDVRLLGGQSGYCLATLAKVDLLTALSPHRKGFFEDEPDRFARNGSDIEIVRLCSCEGFHPCLLGRVRVHR